MYFLRLPPRRVLELWGRIHRSFDNLHGVAMGFAITRLLRYWIYYLSTWWYCKIVVVDLLVYQANRCPTIAMDRVYKVFLTRFVPKRFKDRHRDTFLWLEQGQMTVSQHMVKVSELSLYAIVILPSERERIYSFVWRLRPQLSMDTHGLVSSHLSFLDIIGHVCSLE